MPDVAIRAAGSQDAARINAALRALSEGMGDVHRTSDAALARAGFGDVRAFHAVLAEAGGELVGVVLGAPLYSTTRGRAGVYVSDLWVSADQRGQRLGERLLVAMRDHAARLWDAGFVRLAVYESNPRAQRFYERLGFRPAIGETCLTLEGAALDALRGEP